MNKYVESVKQWINKRDKREKIVLFFLSLLLIYSIFNFIFIRPVTAEKAFLQSQINALKSQRETVQQQFEMITSMVNSPEFSSLLTQQQQLAQKTKHVKQKIESLKPIFVAEKDFPQLTKDLLGQLDKTISLVSLKKFPYQRWDIPEIDKAYIPIQTIYQNKIILEFHANFFDTIAYLARLEKLPWHLYWDSLEYKVMKYPDADVVVQLYILSNDKSA
jgi:MSHA biogenesis protein MshJ